MKPVEAERILYIKLGKGGVWEERCLEDGTLRIAYSKVDHARALDSIRGDWNWLRENFPYPARSRGAISSHVNQVRQFYEAGSETIWVTLAKNQLWWCQATEEVQEGEDGGRLRATQSGWKNTDLKGKPLNFERLSGRILATQGFQGTICGMQDRDYVLLRLNGEEPPLFTDARNAIVNLEKVLQRVIQRLHWRDFEILVDLLFRQAGIRRIGGLGETTKSVDLELLAPITDQRISVQVKSRASAKQLNRFRECMTQVDGVSLGFFAVHSPSDSLLRAAADFEPVDDEVRIVVLTPAVLAQWAVRYGLSEWIIDKAG